MVDDSGDLRIEGVLEVKENLPEQNLDQNALLDQFLDTVHNINQLLKEFDPILLMLTDSSVHHLNFYFLEHSRMCMWKYFEVLGG